MTVRTPHGAALLAAVLLSGGAFYLVANRNVGQPRHDPDSPGPEPARTQTPEQVSTAAAEDTPTLEPAADASPQERTPRGRVTSGSQPLPRAEVSRAPLDNSTDEAWLFEMLAGEAKAQPTTSTDAKGEYSLPHEDADIPSVVIATHPRHLASGALGPLPALSLTSATTVLVHVVREDGTPVPNAEVLSFGRVHVEGGAGTVQRRSVTSDDGTAHVSPLPGRSALVARFGAEVSEPWLGRHASLEAPVRLVLRSTFSASGRVTGAPSDALADCRVLVRSARAEDTWSRSWSGWHRDAAATRVGDDGRWNIDSVPWIGAAAYVFRLERADRAPIEIEQLVGAPGRRITVDFAWSEGHPLAFRVLDPDNVPVEGAEVAAHWKDGERWVRIEERTDADGRVAFTDCPEVSLWVRISTEDFAHHASGPYALPAESGEFDIVLQIPARVTGRCLHGGEPAERFSVTYWGADASGRKTEDFRDEEGRFELTRVEPGVVHLLATSTDLPPGPTETAEVEAGAEVEVELRLDDPVVAEGRVVDGATGEPIHGATLQVFTRHQNRLLDPWGPPVETDASGRFAAVPLSPHDNGIRFQAKGYETWTITPENLSDPTIDLGLVALDRPGTLHVQLIAGAGDTAFEEYVLGVYPGPTKRCSADGAASFEGTRPGFQTLVVYTPAGGRMDVDMMLPPGTEWSREVSVGGERTIRVRIETEGDATLPDDLWLTATHMDRTGCPTRGIVPIRNRTSDVSFVEGDSVLLQLIRIDGSIVAASWASVPDDPVVELRLAVNDRAYRLRLVDPSDRPVAEALVSIAEPSHPFAAVMETESDAAGVVHLPALGLERIAVRVLPDLDELCATQEVALTGDGDEPIIVRVDATHRVRARLVERGVPGAGVGVQLYEPGNWKTLIHATSDAHGHVDLEALSADAFDLHVEGGGGWWPMTFPVTAASDPVRQDFEVRRLGGVTLRATQAGIPLAGVRLEVTSVEYAEPVDQWLAAGRAFAGDNGTTTDAAGEVVLEGLPNGPYTWRAWIQSEAVAAGELEVAPLEHRTVSLELP